MGNTLEKLHKTQQSLYKKADDLENELRGSDPRKIRSLMRDLKYIYEKLKKVHGDVLKEIPNQKNDSDKFLNDLNKKMDVIEDWYKDLSRRVRDRGINIEETTVEDILKGFGKFALRAGLTTGVVLGTVTFAPAALGFGAGGVAAGSLAAAYQSAVLGGTIASGSTFAVLQSVGAAGLAAGTQAGLAAASVAGNAIYSLATKK